MYFLQPFGFGLAPTKPHQPPRTYYQDIWLLEVCNNDYRFDRESDSNTSKVLKTVFFGFYT